MLPALVSSLVLAAPSAYEVGIRTEARASSDAGDLQLDPGISLNTPFGRYLLVTSYTPRILGLERPSGNSVTLLHRARLMGEHRSKGRRIYLEEQLIYGDDSFSWLVAGADGQPVFNRLTELPPFRYFSEGTTLGIEQPLSRSVGLNTTAAYGVNGGVGSARSLVPLQHGPRLTLGLVWSLGTRDAVLGLLDGSAAYFSTGVRAYLVEASGGWRHKLSRRTQFDIAAGAGVGSQRGGDVQTSQVYPYLSARLQRGLLTRRNDDVGFSIRVLITPAVDPLTGSVYATAQGFGALDYYPVPKLDLTATAGDSLGLGGALRGYQLSFGGLSASYELNHHLNLMGGMRFATQPSFEWVGFVAVLVSDRGHL